ncbi:hypothetical protein [Microvirga sp. M2]|uniref:hypothetical protein n=1 Tax=Microvirga sp. M2 TaxID=3073270 RepID=UPI0039C35F95
MGYAGYGNHSEPPQPPDAPQESLPQESPPGGATPGAGPPGSESADPFREVQVDHAKFARIEPGLTPPWHEISPHRRDGNPTVSPEATREISTPAEGAGPLPTEGDDVDPGLG